MVLPHTLAHTYALAQSLAHHVLAHALRARVRLLRSLSCHLVWLSCLLRLPWLVLMRLLLAKCLPLMAWVIVLLLP